MPINYLYKHLRAICTIIIFVLSSITYNLEAQAVGDYRSISSGNWTTVSIWEIYDGSSWISAINSPSKTLTNHLLISAGDSVIIGATDTVFLANSINVEGILNVLGGLHCYEHKVIGSGTFRLQGGLAILGIGNFKGISFQDTTGNIITQNRFFSEQSTYCYQGSGRQEIGNAIPTNIKSLVIDNKESFDEQSGVRINKKIHISDTLLFIQGKTFAIDSSTLIVMGPNSLSKGHGIYSYNSGPIRYSWQVASHKRHFIPIGKDTLYRPLDITYNHNSSALNVYQYELINTGPSYTAIANSAGFTSISTLRYWECFRITGNSVINNSLLGFTWGPSDNIENYLALDIGRSNSSRTEWNKAQGNPSHTGSNTFGFVFVADNNPSTAFDYILASNTSNNFLLPVNSIKAIAIVCNSSTYEVSWKVYGEQEVTSYQISFYDALGSLLFKKEVLSSGNFDWEKSYLLTFSSSHQIEAVLITEVTMHGTAKDLIRISVSPCDEILQELRILNPSPVNQHLQFFHNSPHLLYHSVEISIYKINSSACFKMKTNFIELLEKGIPHEMMPDQGHYILNLSFPTQSFSFQLIRY